MSLDTVAQLHAAEIEKLTKQIAELKAADEKAVRFDKKDVPKEEEDDEHDSDPEENLQEVERWSDSKNAIGAGHPEKSFHHAAVYFSHKTGKWYCDQCKRHRLTTEHIRSLGKFGLTETGRLSYMGRDLQGLQGPSLQVDGWVPRS